MKLSIIIPVYNEIKTLPEILRQIQAVNLPKELVFVDDGSQDGSRDFLKNLENLPDVKVLYHKKNMGKGAAVRTGIENCSGDFVIVQDADLEYDPADIPKLYNIIKTGKADVVYGSRNLGEHKSYSYLYYLGNKFLTLTTNILYNTLITDMETCYKMFKREIILSIKIKSKGFDMEPEITSKILKKGIKIYEVPIKYSARSREEGKKITWVDGLKALFILIKYRFIN